jgi:hypothetical protein
VGEQVPASWRKTKVIWVRCLLAQFFVCNKYWQMKTYLHSGDLGDCIMSCASIKCNGGGILYAADKPWTRPFICRMPLLQRLLDEQEYIQGFYPHGEQHIDYDFSTFRQGGHEFGKTLAGLQAAHVRIPVDVTQSWLKVRPSSQTEGKIVVSRTPRYRNDYFPWKELVETFRDCIYFIGIWDEYVDFVRKFGDIRYLVCDDLYDVAAAIAGSELYIGNQCGPTAICEALKHRMVQEVDAQIPDCIYPRDNATFCVDGGLRFEACGREFIAEPFVIPFTPNLQEAPPGGWRVKWDIISVEHYNFQALVENFVLKCREHDRVPPDNLKDLIIKQSYVDVPPPEKLASIKRVEALIANA